MFRGQGNLLEILKASEQEVYEDLSKIFENIDLDMKPAEEIVEELPKKREAPTEVVLEDDRHSVDGLVKLMHENQVEVNCSEHGMQRLVNISNQAACTSFMFRHQTFEGEALRNEGNGVNSLGGIGPGSNSCRHLRLARFIQCYNSNTYSN